MSETSAPLSQATLPGFESATSSPASEASRSGCSGQDGIGRSGPGVFPAKTSRPPARARDSRESEADYGGRGLPLFEPADPFGCSLRTCLRSALAGLTTCSLRWRRKATPAGRSWWVLRLSERRTDGSGCGSSGNWTTPTDFDATSSQPAVLRPSRVASGRTTDYLSRQAQMIPGNKSTQVSEVTHERNARPLSEVAGLLDQANPSTTGKPPGWPTPRTIDGRDKGNGPRPDTLTGAINYEGKKRVGSLNQAWVCQLMGYPDCWLDVDDESNSAR